MNLIFLNFNVSLCYRNKTVVLISIVAEFQTSQPTLYVYIGTCDWLIKTIQTNLWSTCCLARYKFYTRYKIRSQMRRLFADEKKIIIETK